VARMRPGIFGQNKMIKTGPPSPLIAFRFRSARMKPCPVPLRGARTSALPAAGLTAAGPNAFERLTTEGLRWPKRPLPILVSALSLIATTACTISESRLSPPPAGSSGELGPHLTLTRGVGLVVGRRHVALGWMKELLVDIPDPDDCRLILVIERPGDFTELQKVLATTNRDFSNVCVLQPARGKK
jgi:hypothetical protein